MRLCCIMKLAFKCILNVYYSAFLKEKNAKTINITHQKYIITYLSKKKWSLLRKICFCVYFMSNKNAVYKYRLFKRIIRPCRILYFTGKESNIDIVLNVKMNIGVKFILSLSLSLSLLSRSFISKRKHGFLIIKCRHW